MSRSYLYLSIAYELGILADEKLDHKAQSKTVATHVWPRTRCFIMANTHIMSDTRVSGPKPETDSLSRHARVI